MAGVIYIKRNPLEGLKKRKRGNLLRSLQMQTNSLLDLSNEPSKKSEKQTNQSEIATDHTKVTITILPREQYLLCGANSKAILEKYANSPEILLLLPEIEPKIPSDGWKYKLVEPFIPQSAKDNVIEAIETGNISSLGMWPKKMSEKLKEIYEVPVAQPCSSGFTALILALQAANISQGDEVIIPSFTFIAVANAVHFLRATPIFADSTSENYNPSWENIEKVSSSKTKAIIITHTYGVPAPDIQLIVEECRLRGWWLIEDISQCVGVSGKDSRLLGTYGDFTCASLFLSKMIHGGDGGFVLARQKKYESRLASLVNHGFIPGLYYVHMEPAINGKINALGAATACGCLDQLQDVIRSRALISTTYRRLLSSLQQDGQDSNRRTLIPICGPIDTPWVFGVHCQDKRERQFLRAILANQAIETRDFFFPIHLQPAYQHLGIKPGMHYPNAEKFGTTGFYLPTHFSLTKNDQEFICSVLLTAVLQ